MAELDEIVREFLLESHEGLDRMDRDFVALEQSPGDLELLKSIFRAIHTIKGTCGFLGFGRLEGVTHAGESLLALLRDGVITLRPELASLMLRMVDAVRAMLAEIEATGGDGERDYAELVADLQAMVDAHSRRTRDPAVVVPPGGRERRKPRPRAKRAAAPLVPAAPAAPAAPEPEDAVAAEARAPAVADSSIRVDVELLDRLMNLVGELVLARNQVLQHAGAAEDAGFLATSQRLNLITTELQEGVMKTRMQPIGNVWSRFPRVVRDLAHACGKQVALEMDGRETELDKTIIEAIRDPLTHIVRTAGDHGIEAPAARGAAGKPAEGRLALRAYHEGGQVNIEIADDGAGVDVEAVRRKAVERGVVAADVAARMGDRELHHLIFQPGFSTAAKVTNVSGRGVGMDVVKTNIEKIGGTVDLQSVAGQGTVIRIKIPLTLAIIPALTVASGGERFAIPQVNLLELVRLGEGHAVEELHGAPVYRLRGKLLPILHLDRILGLGRREALADATIVVLRADDRAFGLVVDEVTDTTEIVVKPLGKQLKGLAAFAGATIMGDGRVALILDVLGLAQRAGVVGEARERARAEGAEPAQAATGDERSLLVLGAAHDRRVAVPLDLVARLEEVEAAAVEWAGGQEVLQYRGGILPLVRLARALGLAEPAVPPARLPLVVHTDAGRPVGLVVDAIHDIVQARLTVERPVDRPDLLGTAVIQGHVTDLLDLGALVRAARAAPAPAATEA
jgi:two-component system chemotaxis sensor kinase CheA